eukprot:scaffold18612_cov118-Isochrysis_galbana.AAC.3
MLKDICLRLADQVIQCRRVELIEIEQPDVVRCCLIRDGQKTQRKAEFCNKGKPVDLERLGVQDKVIHAVTSAHAHDVRALRSSWTPRLLQEGVEARDPNGRVQAQRSLCPGAIVGLVRARGRLRHELAPPVRIRIPNNQHKHR